MAAAVTPTTQTVAISVSRPLAPWRVSAAPIGSPSVTLPSVSSVAGVGANGSSLPFGPAPVLPSPFPVPPAVPFGAPGLVDGDLAGFGDLVLAGLPVGLIEWLPGVGATAG